MAVTVPPAVTVVVPTVGRPSLQEVLRPVAGRLPVVVVDDRHTAHSLDVPDGVTVLRSFGRGPAAARNVGWAHSQTAWVAFLDDDVVPGPSWVDDLLADLEAAELDVAGVQGRLLVPVEGPGTDWARSTKGLETAVWATADLAYRRAALNEVGGFDERFPRAYREDADLGLRVTQAGWRIETGRRQVVHPVRPARWTQSLRSQRGNADDVLMRAVHGPSWRELAHVPRGRRPWHLATTAALAMTTVPRLRPVAVPLWAALTADFARRRIRRGTGPQEVATMAVTSVALPPAATWWWLRGWASLPGNLERGGPVRQR